MSSSLNYVSAGSFIKPSQPVLMRRMKGTTFLSVVSKAKDTPKTDAMLRFVSSYSYTSSPVYLQRQNTTLATHTLHQFFSHDEHRNCLLVGSGNIKVTKPSFKNVGQSAFDSRWNQEALHFQSKGIERSSKGMETLELSVKTPFLVFLIHAVAEFGVRQTKDGDSEELFADGKVHSPEYQFLLLAEDFAAEGPPPLVWIFNQLTGKGGYRMLPLKASNEEHNIHFYLRVWASDSKSIKGDIKADRIVFKATCRAEINIKFPSILLNILPASKEIIEKQANKALVQSMERDIVPGVNEFREAFIKWQRRQ
jgi:hypothetical protein